MANRIKMAMGQAILALRGRGWSYRRIARELGVHRETVSRHVRLAGSLGGKSEDGAGSKPAIVTAGNGGMGESKPAIVAAGNPGQRSQCEPFRPVILKTLGEGLTAQRIYQDLVGDHGFAGSYSSVKRFVRRLRAASPLPFRRMECGPGEEAQVDFGRGGPVVGPDGRRRMSKVFRVVLCYSRKGYSESVWGEKTEPFLRSLENAFWHFGGVPRTVVIPSRPAP